MRMKLIAATLCAMGLLAALAIPAAAHTITVTNPQTGEVAVADHWIGGFTLPEAAWDAPPVFGPFHLPASHGHGLPMACASTEGSPAVEIKAPPNFTTCIHGNPDE